MKVNVLLAAALLLVSASVFGNEEPRNTGFAVVPVKGSEVYKVIYKNEGSTKVKLNLYNADGQIIFSETISEGAFIRPLNFAGLNPGQYSVEVVDGNSKVVESIAYKLETATVSANSTKAIHVSKVVGQGEKFVVSIANANNNDFVINIYGANNTIIHTDAVSVEDSTAKLYNVKTGKVSKIEVVDAAGIKVERTF